MTEIPAEIVEKAAKALRSDAAYGYPPDEEPGREEYHTETHRLVELALIAAGVPELLDAALDELEALRRAFDGEREYARMVERERDDLCRKLDFKP